MINCLRQQEEKAICNLFVGKLYNEKEANEQERESPMRTTVQIQKAEKEGDKT